MEHEFVPKKTITVQLTLEDLQKFSELCEALKLTKTKMVEKMIDDAYVNLLFGK